MKTLSTQLTHQRTYCLDQMASHIKLGGNLAVYTLYGVAEALTSDRSEAYHDELTGDKHTYNMSTYSDLFTQKAVRKGSNCRQLVQPRSHPAACNR